MYRQITQKYSGVSKIVVLSSFWITPVLQTFNESELVKCVEELVRVDREWVPYSSTGALYLRPTFIGTDVSNFCTNDGNYL